MLKEDDRGKTCFWSSTGEGGAGATETRRRRFFLKAAHGFGRKTDSYCLKLR